MSEQTIAEIAKGLTKAQRAAIDNAIQKPAAMYGDDVFEVNPGGSTIAMCKKGLIADREFRGLTGRSRRGYTLTKRGHALRAHLLSEGQDHDRE